MKTTYHFPKNYLTVYDNGGQTFDRYTIIFNQQKRRIASGDYLYQSVGASDTGAGFYQHSEAMKGAHLGQKIDFNDLPEELKARFVDIEVFSHDLCQYHRPPTAYELKFGEGATHYKSFDCAYITDHQKGHAKRVITCPVDGLKYYRC